MNKKNQHIHEFLIKQKSQGKLPKVTVFLRIDGPGSSLDLRLWQQSFWKLTKPKDPSEDQSIQWSKGLPRTVGMTINIGTEIQAEPIEPGKLAVESVDFGFSYTFNKGTIPPMKETWLLRILETFDLDGVKFTIKNQDPALKSAGLGGSAAVTTGVCLLANKLCGSPFTPAQIIGMASMTEEDLGVSITGTQEQSCVLYGGIKDYIWFPWGIPGKDNFYGTSIRQDLLHKEDFEELHKRIDVYFCLQRFSADVNAKWKQEMQSRTGFHLHQKKCELAYQFREALRNKQWKEIAHPIEEYRKIRTQLCTDYMSEASQELFEIAKKHNAVIFPLGGGGGSVMVYSHEPHNLENIRKEVGKKFKRIEYKFEEQGHVFEHCE